MRKVYYFITFLLIYSCKTSESSCLKYLILFPNNRENSAIDTIFPNEILKYNFNSNMILIDSIACHRIDSIMFGFGGNRAKLAYLKGDDLIYEIKILTYTQASRYSKTNAYTFFYKTIENDSVYSLFENKWLEIHFDSTGIPLDGIKTVYSLKEMVSL